MKKLLVMAVFGIAGLAAFAGTCVVTHISLVATNGTHKTFAGQLDNTSGVNILQHNFVVAFLDSSNNVVETKSVAGCLRSVQNGETDFFSATSTATSGITTGLARIAFDSAFKVGTTSDQDVSITNIVASRDTNTLTVTGTVKNNSSTKLFAPNACVVVRTSAGNVLITDVDSSMSDLSHNATDTFSVTITVPDDDTADSVDVWVDGLDSGDNPTTPEGDTDNAVVQGGKLVITSEPEDNTGGTVFTTQPVVKLEDENDDVLTDLTNSVTLSIVTGPTGGALTCTANPKAAVDGIATFAGCKLDKAGTYVLRASATGFTSDDTSNIVITVGAAAKLKFTTQPVGAAATVNMATQPVVTVQDAGGNTVTTSVAPVTLTIGGTGAGVLSCTTNPQAAVAGVATFAGCQISVAGSNTLTAASTGLTSDTSSAITTS